MEKNKLVPMLFTSMKDYSGKQFVSDVVAGIIVAIIALPLSIALALASGVGPEQGIYTAIVGGFLISFFGGSHVQIAGPTAAFATIVAGIVAKDGMDGLMLATIIAGVLLILMGIFKVGSLIKFIPYTITTGFTAGIAVTIIIGQIKDFCGLTYAAGVKPVETMEKLEAIVQSIGTINWLAVLVGAISLAILILWPYVSQKIPGSLIAVIVGILLVKLTGMKVNTIGDLYTISSSLPTLHVPHFTFALLKGELSNGFTIAVLAAIESLLSCVVADGMINTKHRSNQELVAQGIGNIGSALFGGIPATGAIARTAANIKNGGRTPVAGMVHAIVLVLVLVFLMPYAALIPMPTIAAILFMVAYNMSGWRNIKTLCEGAPAHDLIVLWATFALTIIFDLVVAIEIGMVASCVLFMKRMSDEAHIDGWQYFSEEANDDPDYIELRQVPDFVRVYEVTGPLFFGVAEQINSITFKEYTKVLILRMKSVPAIDATAMTYMEKLLTRCNEAGITLVLSHVNDQPYKVMQKCGFLDRVGTDNLLPHIGNAVHRAVELYPELPWDHEQNK